MLCIYIHIHIFVSIFIHLWTVAMCGNQDAQNAPWTFFSLVQWHGLSVDADGVALLKLMDQSPWSTSLVSRSATKSKQMADAGLASHISEHSWRWKRSPEALLVVCLDRYRGNHKFGSFKRHGGYDFDLGKPWKAMVSYCYVGAVVILADPFGRGLTRTLGCPPLGQGTWTHRWVVSCNSKIHQEGQFFSQGYSNIMMNHFVYIHIWHIYIICIHMYIFVNKHTHIYICMYSLATKHGNELSHLWRWLACHNWDNFVDMWVPNTATWSRAPYASATLSSSND